MPPPGLCTHTYWYARAMMQYHGSRDPRDGTFTYELRDFGGAPMKQTAPETEIEIEQRLEHRSKKRTQIAAHVVLWTFALVAIALCAMYFATGVVMVSIPYVRNVHVHTRHGYNILWFGSSSDAVEVLGPTHFADADIRFRMTGDVLIADNGMVARLWIFNTTTSKYTLVTPYVQYLMGNVTVLLDTVDPDGLLEFLELHAGARRRSTTPLFVEYLADTESAIETLQTSYTQMTNTSVCRGKPFEVATFPLVGSQTLVANTTALLAWTVPTQLPVGSVANFAASTNISTSLTGVYALSVYLTITVPASTNATVTANVLVNGVVATASGSTLTNTLGAATTTQATAWAVLTLQSGTILSVTAFTSSTGVVITQSNTRLLASRAC